MRTNPLDLIISLAVLIVFGIACGSSPVAPAKSSPSPTPVPSMTTLPGPAAGPAETPATDSDTEALKKKLAELEKKLDSQQGQPAEPAVTPPTIAPPPPPVTKVTPPPVRNTGANAWVNSPDDGFLALRSEPSPNLGYRIVQIPHGAGVRVSGCQGITQRIGARSGRWCRVSWNGYYGWAFDGWLNY